MIKLLTGYSNCGGSTNANALLCNLFNDNGIQCEFYGPSDWVKRKLTGDYYRPLDKLSFTPDDRIIYHFLNIKQRPNVKKLILSCHETNVFPIKEVDVAYDKIHFVSNSQKNWQGVDGVVIPNTLPNLKKKTTTKSTGIAAILGSIDPHKRTHLSIQRALKNTDVSRIELWGDLTDWHYFRAEVMPLLNRDVIYCGVSDYMQQVYDNLDCVYHSSQRETFNYIKAECNLTGVRYYGLPESDPSSEYWDNQKILEAWKNLIFT